MDQSTQNRLHRTDGLQDPAEANGNAQQALSFYKEIKDQWANAPESLEIDKYITRIENAQ